MDFGGWFEIPGGGRTKSAPAVVTFHHETFQELNVFVRGLDDSIFRKTFRSLPPPTVGWSEWFRYLPDFKTPSAPAAIVFNTGVGPQVLYTFARSTDSRIFFSTAVGGSGGSVWKEVPGGGSTKSSPAAVITDALTSFPSLTLFVRALDDSVMQNTLSREPGKGLPEKWSGWTAVPPGNGSTLDSPAATRRAGGGSSVLVRGLNNRIFRNTVAESTSSWSGWK